MGILEFIFKGAIKDKKEAKAPVCLNTNRSMPATNPQEIELKKREEELLSKIRADIEHSRKYREKQINSVSKILKLTKEGVLKLEDQIYTEQYSNLHTIQKDTSKDFYKQYSMGQFVVSL